MSSLTLTHGATTFERRINKRDIYIREDVRVLINGSNELGVWPDLAGRISISLNRKK
jgi:hypothetical protein